MKRLVLVALLALTVAGCKSAPKDEPIQEKAAVKSAEVEKEAVHKITSVAEFEQLAAQKDRLMVIDLYADWCGPCKMLAPILEKVAKSHGEKADFYKVDTEDLPQLARMFQVQGIPYVVFFKDGGIVNAYTGLYPQEAYEQAVEILSQELPDTAHGDLSEGNRQITISGNMKVGNVVAYRGDVVDLTVTATGKPFTVSLPDFEQSGSSDGNSDVKLSFKVKDLGFFKLEITDETGRNDRLWFGVIQYGAGESSYKEVDAQAFSQEIAKENTFLLDVRTDGEFKAGHIKGATLIPVQDLERRLSELDGVKEKTVAIYCRSGNRSTVAAKILKEAGFKNLVNLRPGIKAWERAGLPVEK